MSTHWGIVVSDPSLQNQFTQVELRSLKSQVSCWEWIMDFTFLCWCWILIIFIAIFWDIVHHILLFGFQDIVVENESWIILFCADSPKKDWIVIHFIAIELLGHDPFWRYCSSSYCLLCKILLWKIRFLFFSLQLIFWVMIINISY